MTGLDKILKFDRYELTGCIGIINEDNLTAQQLHIKNANKMKECLIAVSDISDFVASIGYKAGDEELTITIAKRTTTTNALLNNSYRWIFNRDAISIIELAHNVSSAVNECLNAVETTANNLVDLVNAIYDEQAEELTLFTGDNPTIADSLKDIKDQVNASYVYPYDECSYTVLELAGNTACQVNECVKAVNMLADMYNKVINNLKLTFNSNSEELTILGGK